eukprot:1161639-Pelagomonas_calceolata.AAC.13
MSAPCTSSKWEASWACVATGKRGKTAISRNNTGYKIRQNGERPRNVHRVALSLMACLTSMEIPLPWLHYPMIKDKVVWTMVSLCSSRNTEA